MKAVAYDPATRTIRLCKLKSSGKSDGKAVMTEAHEDVTEMCIRAVVALILTEGAVPMVLNGKRRVLAVLTEEEIMQEDKK